MKKNIKINLINNYNRLYVYEYINKACYLNNKKLDLFFEEDFLKEEYFIKINSFIDELSKAWIFFLDWNNFNYWIVFVPKNWNKNLKSYQLWYLWTNWKQVTNFLKVFSNWQFNEKKNEQYLNCEIDSWWYFYTRSMIWNFANMSYYEQINSEKYFEFNKIIKKHFSLDCGLLPDINPYYAALVFDSIINNNLMDMPLFNSFIRTSTYYSDWTQLWVLGSSYWVDIDGFWHGDWWTDNISLWFCIKLES